MKRGGKERAKYGDFQTPAWFAHKVCAFLSSGGVAPKSILEPTCGVGNFLLAALEVFTTADAALGVDINQAYVAQLREQVDAYADGKSVDVMQADFFQMDWSSVLRTLPDPVLVVGNPPWVTNADATLLDSGNLPPKRNIGNHAGIEAITGASNFDISEWMLLRMIAWIADKQGVVAVLCKTSVARRVLRQVWQEASASGSAQIHLFNAQEVFNVAVDACLFIYDTTDPLASQTCQIYEALSTDSLAATIGYRDKQLVADVNRYERWKHLQRAAKSVYRWRSGIKHDCAGVMELRRVHGTFVNLLGETVTLEDTYVYPLLKSSDIATARQVASRWMVVPQRAVGENTQVIQRTAPLTWAYLSDHAEMLDGRRSVIYRHQPRFSVFGVGPYAFARWKVGISGLYKQLEFVVVGPQENRPTVLDDTCYFLACDSEGEAVLLADLLRSRPAREFYASFIFWDAKRPITARILNKLDLFTLAEVMGRRAELEEFVGARERMPAQQLRLFD